MTKSSVVKVTEAPVPEVQPATESSALISMIERAARDSSVDIDKMERLMLMHEKIESRRAEQAFNAAMALAQSEMLPIARKIQNKHLNTHYADLAAVSDGVTPIVGRHGFGLSFSEFQSTVPDCMGIACEVTHAGGFSKRYEFNVPIDGAGLRGNANKTAVQTYGSTFTYGRRYAMLGVFNVATKTDTDGNRPKTEDGPISDKQIAELTKLITDTGSNIDQFLEFCEVPSLADIWRSNFDKAKALLLAKQKKQAEKGTAQ